MPEMPSSNGTQPTDIAECSVCIEKVRLPDIAVIDNTPVCHDCVKQIFINAAEDESNYPPRWGEHELKMSHYKHILDGDLIKQYRKKTHEYRKKWDERVYCSTEQDGKICGEYLGGHRDKDVHTRLSSTCKKCSQKTCLACKAQPGSRAGHACEASAEEKNQEAMSFKGLTKGKDWQKCPHCKRNIELKDGCNHVVCLCGTSLCFVCGQPAKGTSNHWSKVTGEGSACCPRYNHPNDTNAIWQREALLADLFAAPRDAPRDVDSDEVDAVMFAGFGFPIDRRGAMVEVPEAQRGGQLPQRVLQDNAERVEDETDARAASFDRNLPPSQAATAAGTVAQNRRLGRWRGQRGVRTSEDPIDLEAPATAQRLQVGFRAPSRLPRDETDILGHTDRTGIGNAVAPPWQRISPQVPRPSSPGRQRRQDITYNQGPGVAGEELRDPDPTMRFGFPAAAQRGNDSAAGFGRQPSPRITARPEDVLMDVLLSPPPEASPRPRPVASRRPRPVAAPRGATSPRSHSPQIPERGSSLQHRAESFTFLQRYGQPSYRGAGLNFDFQFPTRRSAADTQEDTTMTDG